MAESPTPASVKKAEEIIPDIMLAFSNLKGTMLSVRHDIALALDAAIRQAEDDKEVDQAHIKALENELLLSEEGRRKAEEERDSAVRRVFDAVREERERCAKIADDHHCGNLEICSLSYALSDYCQEAIADAIRYITAKENHA